MAKLIVKWMFVAALAQFGWTLASPRDFEKAARKVTEIDWKPISMSPEEAKKIR